MTFHKLGKAASLLAVVVCVLGTSPVVDLGQPVLHDLRMLVHGRAFSRELGKRQQVPSREASADIVKVGAEDVVGEAFVGAEAGCRGDRQCQRKRPSEKTTNSPLTAHLRSEALSELVSGTHKHWRLDFAVHLGRVMAEGLEPAVARSEGRVVAEPVDGQIAAGVVLPHELPRCVAVLAAMVAVVLGIDSRDGIFAPHGILERNCGVRNRTGFGALETAWIPIAGTIIMDPGWNGGNEHTLGGNLVLLTHYLAAQPRLGRGKVVRRLGSWEFKSHHVSTKRLSKGRTDGRWSLVGVFEQRAEVGPFIKQNTDVGWLSADGGVFVVDALWSTTEPEPELIVWVSSESSPLSFLMLSFLSPIPRISKRCTSAVCVREYISPSRAGVRLGREEYWRC